MERFLVPLCVVLGCFFSYFLGYIARGEQLFIPIIDRAEERCAAYTIYDPVKGAVVASKKGTTYYFPWCSGHNRIKPENKRWFSTVSEAQKYGLKPAKNCLGM